MGPDGADALRWFFQARHLYEHKAGVIDERFVAKVPRFSGQKGQILSLPTADLIKSINVLEELVRKLDAE